MIKFLEIMFSDPPWKTSLQPIIYTQKLPIHALGGMVASKYKILVERKFSNLGLEILILKSRDKKNLKICDFEIFIKTKI